MIRTYNYNEVSLEEILNPKMKRARHKAVEATDIQALLDSMEDIRVDAALVMKEEAGR